MKTIEMTNKRIYGRTNGYMDGQTDIWTDKGIYGRTNGYMDGKTDIWTDKRI